MAIKLEEAWRILRSKGYCLWVGAGVTKQLARAGGVSVPDWGELVSIVEADAKVGAAPSEATFPERLDVCLKSMERERFQKILKLSLIDKLRASILEAARSHQLKEDLIPAEIRQLARLGHLANPIVNFNIETFTSTALASPGGEFAVRAFNPTPGRSQMSRGNLSSERFTRAVYHPHGALDMYGLCVMCERDYQTLDGTLALQLAAHSAFESDLAIVGMSLDDDYLRRQIADFRHHIRSIFWFRSDDPDKSTAYWAWRNEVEIIVQPWSQFWNSTAILPAPEEISITGAWMGLISSAFTAPMHEHLIPFLREHTNSLNDMMPSLRTAMLQGEEIDLAIFERRSKPDTASQQWIPIDPDSPQALLTPLLKHLGTLARSK